MTQPALAADRAAAAAAGTIRLTTGQAITSRRASALVFDEMAAGMDDVLSGRRAAAVANPHVYEPARTP